MNLADQIAHLEAKEHPRPEEVEIIKTLRFLAKWEPEIRASLPAWILSRQVTEQLPGAKATLREDGYHEIVLGGENGEA